MTCNSEYLEPFASERELSKVACLLDELDGKPLVRHHWRGFHPLVYNKKVDGNRLVADLCSRLQRCDVTQYSLEMQIWWRDHQQADKNRIKKELQQKKEAADRDKALSKLNSYERNLLGLKTSREENQ